MELRVCVGLKPDASDPTTGPDDKKGIAVCGAPGGVGLKAAVKGGAGGLCGILP